MTMTTTTAAAVPFRGHFLVASNIDLELYREFQGRMFCISQECSVPVKGDRKAANWLHRRGITAAPVRPEIGHVVMLLRRGESPKMYKYIGTPAEQRWEAHCLDVVRQSPSNNVFREYW